MSIVQYTSADNTLMAAQKGCRYQRQFGVLISVLSAVISLWLLSFNMVDAALISKPPANLGLVGYWSMNPVRGRDSVEYDNNSMKNNHYKLGSTESDGFIRSRSASNGVNEGTGTYAGDSSGIGFGIVNEKL